MKNNRLFPLAVSAIMLTCFSIAAAAQDIITKKDGSEIKADVTRVTAAEVEYRKYGADGPLYTLPKSDIFMIKYRDGDKEVFAGTAAANTAYNAAPQSSVATLAVTDASDYKRNCFRLDAGFGVLGENSDFGFDAGLGWLHNFNKYIGWDVFNLKGAANTDFNYINLQLMTGAHFEYPLFSSMAGYGDFKIGVGMASMNASAGSGGASASASGAGGGVCLEFGFGWKFTSRFFMGFIYNYQGGSVDMEVSTTINKKTTNTTQSVDIKGKYFGLKLGFTL